jgi:1,4-dihydroxy-2-naphthoyl-CoA hydrolase
VAKETDWTSRINSLASGWVREMGITITSATTEGVAGELEVTERHHQGLGIVHGGVYCGVIETLSSLGAAIVASAREQSVVGLENSTSFLRAVRGGRLRASAVPVTRGRTTQLWEGRIWDAEDRLVATGRVRLLCLDAGGSLDGRSYRFMPEPDAEPDGESGPGA